MPRLGGSVNDLVSLTGVAESLNVLPPLTAPAFRKWPEGAETPPRSNRNRPYHWPFTRIGHMNDTLAQHGGPMQEMRLHKTLRLPKRERMQDDVSP